MPAFVGSDGSLLSTLCGEGSFGTVVQIAPDRFSEAGTIARSWDAKCITRTSMLTCPVYSRLYADIDSAPSPGPGRTRWSFIFSRLSYRIPAHPHQRIGPMNDAIIKTRKAATEKHELLVRRRAGKRDLDAWSAHSLPISPSSDGKELIVRLPPGVSCNQSGERRWWIWLGCSLFFAVRWNRGHRKPTRWTRKK